MPLYAQWDRESQQLRDYINPEELVTLSENLPFGTAVEILSKVSEKLTGKRIVSMVEFNEPIGIQIDKMPYKKALIVIVQYHGFFINEKADVITVQKVAQSNKELDQDVYASIDTREVKISAIFFEANVNEMRERGINWQWLLSKEGIKIGTNFQTFAESSAEADASGGTGGAGESGAAQDFVDFSVTSETDFSAGSFSGNALNVFKFFETEDLGDIIASPNITVRDRMKGKIQIGSDISIKQRDIAGNVIDQFYSTGTIIDVTPYIYNEEGINYVLLKLTVERSSAKPDVLSTEITKTEAVTDILMLDGEETVIGGLYVNQESNVRRGIPILKDLPWWFLGIRYLTGYDQKSITKKEVIILIKTELVPTLKERMNKSKEENLIRKQRLENMIEYQKYKTDSLNTIGDK